MNNLEDFREIHTMIFDVDGVLTNSELIITESGQLLRKMNTRDGYAMKVALEAGLRICIITGGNSHGVEKRLKGLGIQDVYTGISDKLSVLEEYIKKYNLNLGGVLYMGDDIPDYDPMSKVGMPVCPKDATVEIQNVSRFISSKKGGEGCVRDIIEKVMKLQGKWVSSI